METNSLSLPQIETLMEALTQFTDNLRDTLEGREGPEADDATPTWYATMVEQKRLADDMLESVERAHHHRLMGGEP